MNNIVYGLKDPRNDVYMYIGKSTVGDSRALQHLTKSHSEKINEWVKELEDKWLYPIVEIISEMIYGKGLDATDSRRKPDAYARMKVLFSEDCVRKLAYDLKLMGGCAMQVIYSKDRKSIAKVEHFPVEMLRAEKANPDGDIEGYYYAQDWNDVRPNDELQRIPAFGTSREAIEILFVKPYRRGSK